MGHAAGQLADGLHLLALGQLQLDLLLLGHVDQVGHEAAVALGQVEVSDAGGIVGQAHLDRRGGAGALAELLGGVGPAGGFDEIAEDLALFPTAGDGLERRVGLDDDGLERVLALQKRRAEGRGRGEGVQHLGRRRLGAGEGGQHLHGGGRQGQGSDARARQAHQEPALAQR